MGIPEGLEIKTFIEKYMTRFKKEYKHRKPQKIVAYRGAKFELKFGHVVCLKCAFYIEKQACSKYKGSHCEYNVYKRIYTLSEKLEML